MGFHTVTRNHLLLICGMGVVALGCCLSACSGEGDSSRRYYESSFVKIRKVLLEDSFQPGEVRRLSLVSAEPASISLITDCGAALSAEERKDGRSEIRLSSEDHPAEYVATTFGAGTTFHPENGTIRLVVQNSSALKLRIAVRLEDREHD